MEDQHKHQLLLRIAIGAAWADGHLEPAEVEYLEKILTRRDLLEDRELVSLLQTPVSHFELQRWLVDYFQQTTTSERLQTLATIANLLMADGVVTEAEHDLLDEFHTLMATIPPQPEDLPPETIVNLGKSLGRYVRRAIETAKHLITGQE